MGIYDFTLAMINAFVKFGNQTLSNDNMHCVYSYIDKFLNFKICADSTICNILDLLCASKVPVKDETGEITDADAAQIRLIDRYILKMLGKNIESRSDLHAIWSYLCLDVTIRKEIFSIEDPQISLFRTKFIHKIATGGEENKMIQCAITEYMGGTEWLKSEVSSSDELTISNNSAMLMMSEAAEGFDADDVSYRSTLYTVYKDDNKPRTEKKGAKRKPKITVNKKK